ncbi:MAG: putative O-linked N-acetylglucosamine transferase, family, partial [Betaproteobacteria bacterium]|nr:putative O-linked N-acetylglucosamine transferase, family [Betaproteobacteria bacterium]
MTASRQLIEQAIAFHQSGAVIEAEACYRSVLAEDARHFDALHNLGLLKAQCGDFEPALTLLSRALEVKPQSLQARLSQAHVLQALGRLEEALASCEAALKVEPEVPVARYMRGNLLLMLNRVDAALVEYDRVVELTPD